MKKKNIRVVVLTLLILILAAGCAQEEPAPVIESAATVNGVPIALSDYEALLDQTIATYEQYGIKFDTEESEPLKEEISGQVIDTLIDNEILLQEARNQGFEVSQERLAEELEILKGQFGTPEAYDTALSDSGYSEEDLLALMEDEIVVNDYLLNLVKDIVVTEEEIVDYHDAARSAALARYQEMEEPEEPFTYPELQESSEMIKNQILTEKQRELIDGVIDRLRETAEIEILI